MCKTHTLILLFCFVALLAPSPALPQEQPKDGAATGADEALLEDLGGDDLLEGLDDIPIDPAFPDEKPRDPSEQELLDQLGDGEDIQLGRQPNELERIALQMRQVQSRIEGQEVSQQTQQLQERIIADLDALIKELQRQKKQCSPSSNSNPSQASKPSVKQPDQQPDEGQQKPSNKPATDSEERLGQQNVQTIDAAAMEALVKRVWGHLPDRARQELQNASNEEFLPKYQQVIEEYFRRLAEETK